MNGENEIRTDVGGDAACKADKKTVTCFIAVCAAAVVLAAARSWLMLAYYDGASTIWEAGTVLPAVLNVITLAAALAAACLPAAVIRKDGSNIKLPGKTGRFTSFAAMLCGFTVIALPVLCYIYCSGGEVTQYTGNMSLAAQIVVILAAVFAVPAAMRFFMIALGREPFGKISSAFGFFAVLWTAAFLMTVYFDRSSLLNDPLRVMTQLSLLITMAYLLFELRMNVSVPKPRALLGAAFAAIVVSSSSVIPKLVYILAKNPGASVITVYTMTEACILLYIASQCVAVIREKKSGQKSEQI